MHARLILGVVGASLIGGILAAAHPDGQRLNPVIDLLERGQPVFGVYAPSNRRGRGAQSGTEGAAPKAPIDLAREALAYSAADYLFDGSMEAGLERGLPAFAEFVNGMQEAGALRRSNSPRLTHPLIVKTPEIAPDPGRAIENISRQLNLGVSGIVFVKVESADELRHGLAAMRFRSRGGTRPDHVGSAPAYWGMSEPEYREKADLWPLNPNGELVNWTIVESKAGLARLREIAAVKGIGALFPGAGTLRGVFTTVGANGERVFDQAGWENAIQQVLSACKEFNVPCGYPATANDIELRMKQGFSVFVINWGEAGVKAIDIGRKVNGKG